jgi:Arc/MetJ-type ribon-helix-helix transcriptional regulator
MYGRMYGMRGKKKTTIYLSEELKHDIERVASCDGRSEADVIRDALQTAMADRDYPEPRIPLVPYGLGAPDIAERAEELLEGFGR